MDDDTNLFETVEDREFESMRENADAGPVVGSVFGRHVLLEKIGAGGMGVVFAAYDPQLDRKIALKLLNRRVRRGSMSGGSSMLLQEARAMAKLSHPNVIPVHDVGTVDDRVFVAMEFVDGQTLGGWVSERARTWSEIVEVFRQAGRGLAHAHAAGLVHRDFKPDNAIVGSDGRVRVLDFGLARLATPDVTAPEGEEPGIAGTPAYMSPEQHLGGELDARSDQFAFCVALYEALYGERPFGGDTHATIAFGVTSGQLRKTPKDAKVPAWLREAIVRGLCVEADDRWPDMDTLVRELAPRQRNFTAAWIAGGVLAVTAGVAVASSSAETTDRCALEHAQSRVAEVWNDERREAVTSAFAALGTRRGQETAEGVVARLDERASKWSSAWVAACESHERGEWSATLLDRSSACLSRRLRGTGTLVGLFEEGRALDRGMKATDELATIEGCVDPERLTVELPPPEDAETAERVLAARNAIVELDVMLVAGLYEDARVQSLALTAEHAEIDYPALSAEMTLAAALVRAHLAEHAAAVEGLEKAYYLARAIDHREIAVRASSELTLILGYHLSKFDLAAHWGRLAEVELERGSLGANLRARLHEGLGSVALERGDLDEAQTYFESSLAEWGTVPGSAANVLGVRVGLGNLLTTRSEYQAARAVFDRALAELETMYGTSHPDYITVLVNISRLEYSRGDHAAAIDHGQRAIALADETLGPDNQFSMAALRNVANARYDQGQYAPALEVYESLLERAIVRTGHDSLDVAGLYSNAGNALIELDRADDAVAAFEKAIGITERVAGEDHPDLGFPRQGLGSLLVKERRFDEAIPVLLGAISAWERLGESHPLIAWPLTSLGEAYVGLGQPERALAVLRRAIALRAAASEDASVDADLADSRFGLARALVEAGRGGQAGGPAHEAIAVYRALKMDEQVSDVETLLGSI